MNYEVLEAIGQIAREKDIDRAVLLETLEAGLVSATKKRFSDALDVNVTVDPETGDISIVLIKTVVEEVTDPDREISVEDARMAGFSTAAGEKVDLPIPFDDFGRNAVQAAKQVIFQKVREARREKIYNEFKDRVGQLISGHVQQVDRGNIIVMIGNTEALLPWRHQIRRESYVPGENIRTLLLEVLNNTHGPQIILSRGHPDFVRSLFALETPEIREGIVRIEATAREPGIRTKIAVSSRESRVDAVGACVGVKGIRVQAVVRELGGERMDIIPFTSDATMFIARALSPARIDRVILSEDERKACVVVPEDQLSLAIGKGGQNVRLASKLTGWTIELLSKTQHEEHMDLEQTIQIEVVSLPGVGPKLARELEMAGFETVRDVARSATKELTAVPGIGKLRAQKLADVAKVMMKEVEEEVRLRMQQQAEKESTKAASRVAGEAEPQEEPSATSRNVDQPAEEAEPADEAMHTKESDTNDST